MYDHNKLYVPMKGGNQKIMQIHNKNGENEISEFYNKRSDEQPPCGLKGPENVCW